MTIVESGPAPPFSPTGALGLAFACLAGAAICYWALKREYGQLPSTRSRVGASPPWWRMRVTGPNGAPMAAGVIMFLCASISMLSAAIFVWTGANVFGVMGVVAGLGGTLYFFVECGLALFTKKYDN